MNRSTYEQVDERRQRQLYALFTFSMVTAAVVCGALGFLMLMPGTAAVRLGPVSKFTGAADQPVDVAIKQLSISKLIPNRPQLSDDVVFVVREGDAYRAFLGTDPLSGCFLSWRKAEQLFRDSCGQHAYGFTGRNTDQLATATSRPINMVELPVTVKGGALFVEDRIMQRDLR